MSKITSPLKYNQSVFMYAASRALERASYYGMRSIIALYMIRGILSFSEADTMEFYGWFVVSFVAAGVVGAVFGDFILGNRKALLLGIVLMSLGLFLLCVPDKTAFYSAIGLFIIGSGLYTPNLLARFGKQLYATPELTDGGFSILYVLVNVGAFIGIALVSVAAFDNFPLGFFLCGVLMLGSALLSFLSKDTVSEEAKPVVVSNSSYSALLILATILAGGVFWYLYDVSYDGMYYLQDKITEFNPDLKPMTWMNLSTGLSVIVGIAVAVVYSFYYFSRALKLALGYILAAIGIALPLFISVPVSQSGIVIMVAAILFLSLSELILAPVIYGLITQRVNPKYLASIISLTFVPFTIFKAIIPTVFGREITLETTSLKICSPLIAIMGIVALVYWILKKKQEPVV